MKDSSDAKGEDQPRRYEKRMRKGEGVDGGGERDERLKQTESCEG